VFETTFDENVLNRLTSELLSTPFRTDFPDGDGDVFGGPQWKDFSSALLQRHGDNGREILMEIYDLYEAKYIKSSSQNNPFLLSKGWR